MKVSELIAELQQLDPELPVLLQSDPEGNGFFWARGADAISFASKADLESDRTDGLWEESDIDEDEIDEYVRVATVFP